MEVGKMVERDYRFEMWATQQPCKAKLYQLKEELKENLTLN